MRARDREIVHCDSCGGMIVGPSEYDVALCYCPKPKSGGKALPGNELRMRATLRKQLETETPIHEQPARLDHPIATLPWDALEK